MALAPPRVFHALQILKIYIYVLQMTFADTIACNATDSLWAIYYNTRGTTLIISIYWCVQQSTK